MSKSISDEKLYVVEGASPALLVNDMATRRGKKLHLAKQLNTFDDDKLGYDMDVRTLCNMVVYDTKESDWHTVTGYDADCKNCLKLARQL